MDKINIIPNFVENVNFKSLKKYILSPEISWGLNKVLFLNKDCGYHQLCSVVYDNHRICNEHSFNMLLPLLNKLEIRALLRVKLNLLFKTNKIIEHGFHTDYTPPFKGSKTSVFYVNSNNGYTKLKDGNIIKSEENKVVIFDGETEHTGTTCTDEEFRISININFF